MAHPRLLPLRTPLVLGATVVALAASAMPAYAGGDDCGGPEAGDSSVRHLLGGDDCPPAPAPARPAPARPQPAPARPAPAQPVPVVRAPVQPQTPRPTTQRPVTHRVAPVQTRQVVPQQAFVARTVPRGGVQAGAGGTALTHTTQPLPVIAIAALLLGLLSLGSGLRSVHLKPRR
jgi:hypothetical protein